MILPAARVALVDDLAGRNLTAAARFLGARSERGPGGRGGVGALDLAPLDLRGGSVSFRDADVRLTGPGWLRSDNGGHPR